MSPFRITLSTLAIAFTAVGIAAAQSFPTKPVRIVTGPVGGGGDFQSRAIAQAITGPLGQGVIVENRPNNLLGEIVAKAPPDGYTLLIAGGSLWSQTFLQKVNYDPVKDFAPIAQIERSPNLLVVHPSLPVKTTKELIALAKAKPGQLNYSAPAADTRFAAEMFKSMAGIDFVVVPYSNNQTAYVDLLAGQIQLAFGNINTVLPHIKTGRLRALAVTTATPSAMFPDLPTVAQTVPGFDKAGVAGVFAPARTPDPIIRRLNEEVVRYMRTNEAKQKFANIAAEAIASTPEELAHTMTSEMARIAKVVKALNIQPQ